MFTTCAPGKTILFGEHAVVHGVPAIAASVALHTFVAVEPAEFVQLEFPAVKLSHAWKIEDLRELHAQNSDSFSPELLNRARALANASILGDDEQAAFARTAATCFLYLYSTIMDEFTPLKFTTSGTLPVGAGLGSSASFSVCLAAALLKASNRLTDSTPTRDAHDMVTKYSFLGESCIHGKPSGIDNVVATCGGAVYFQRVPDATPVVKIYDKFPELSLILTDTQVSRHTSELVARVADIKQSWPALFDKLMGAFEEVVVQADKLLSSAAVLDLADKVGELAEVNHGLLAAVGVSHPSLELVREMSTKLGMGGTKLTGAGGGGCAITISPDRNPDIRQLKEHLPDFKVFVTKLGGPGVGWTQGAGGPHSEWKYW